MTGWRIIDSEGNEYKNYLSAAMAMRDNPALTFESSEIDMSGVHKKDITELIEDLMHRMNDD